MHVGHVHLEQPFDRPTDVNLVGTDRHPEGVLVLVCPEAFGLLGYYRPDNHCSRLACHVPPTL